MAQFAGELQQCMMRAFSLNCHCGKSSFIESANFFGNLFKYLLKQVWSHDQLRRSRESNRESSLIYAVFMLYIQILACCCTTNSGFVILLL